MPHCLAFQHALDSGQGIDVGSRLSRDLLSHELELASQLCAANVECASTAPHARLNLEGQSYAREMDARPGANLHVPKYQSPTWHT
eukprot:s4879_g3.t1